jgi:hypothetical protein
MIGGVMTTLGLFALGILTGVVIAAGSLAGLAATVSRVGSSSHPGALILVGFAGRLVMAAAVLVFVARLGPAALLGVLVGFVAGRTVLQRRWPLHVVEPPGR